MLLPLLIASGDSVLVNTSSVNGFCAHVRVGVLAEGTSADGTRSVCRRGDGTRTSFI